MSTLTEPPPTDRPHKLLVSTGKVLHYINRTHKLHYTLQHRLDGGASSGAYLLRAKDGSAVSDQTSSQSEWAVLKWNTDKSWCARVRAVEPAINLLHSKYHYMTSAWLYTGTTPSGYLYVIQSYLADTHMCRQDELTVKVINSLVHNFDQQRDFYNDNSELRGPDVFCWTSWLMRNVFDNAQLTMYLTTKYTDQYRRIAALVEPHKDSTLTTTDFVHGDYNLTNTMINNTDGEVCGVVDTEQAGCGSAMLDICNVLMWAKMYDAVAAFEHLYEYAVSYNRPAELALCLSWQMMLQLRYCEYQKAEQQQAIMTACTQLCDMLDAGCVPDICSVNSI